MNFGKIANAYVQFGIGIACMSYALKCVEARKLLTESDRFIESAILATTWPVLLPFAFGVTVYEFATGNTVMFDFKLEGSYPAKKQ